MRALLPLLILIGVVCLIMWFLHGIAESSRASCLEQDGKVIVDAFNSYTGCVLP